MTLRAESITAGYRGTAILRDLSCEVAPGEFAAVLGPNGSGKSTLVRCLVRALPPTEGKVLLDGTDVYRMRPKEFARRVAFVPQETPVGFAFTVREMVSLGVYDARVAKSAVEDALALLDLLPLADRPLTALSGGERQRAAIARALAQETPCLLLDEPTAHLDLRHRLQLLHALRARSRQRQGALLAVLHDLNLAAAYADRLILLHKGEVVATGSPEEVLTPALLHDVYEASVLVKRHPATGRPWVLAAAPAGKAATAAAPAGPVHLLCGGGTGTPLMVLLHGAGIPVTAGVLSVLDSDAETAASLGIPHTTDAPFSPIGEAALSADSRHIEAARHVVVADFPIGPGNRVLLESALNAVRAGKDVLLMAPGTFAERDFTGGDAAPLWEALLPRVRAFESPEELLGYLLGEG